jgi:hypothetical protein
MTNHSYVDINDHDDMSTQPMAICLLATSVKTHIQNGGTW